MSKVLIVEDELSIAELEKDYLELSSFEVEIETDGQQGLEKALKNDFDMIILDIMLPGVDGFEICKQIREAKEIPILMVSARKEDIDKIRGLGLGADDYITKPFNVKLLLARCNNLLRNRRLLLKKLTRTEAMIPQEAGGFTAADQKLLDTASEVIKRNFDNPDFDMNMLASELNMGRSKMFLRLKEVMGLTPNEFTMKLKLEEALRLLQEEPQYNISEISYRLGFTSPRYFSRCFKSFYGVAPLSYRKDSPREDSQAEEDIQE